MLYYPSSNTQTSFDIFILFYITDHAMYNYIKQISLLSKVCCRLWIHRQMKRITCRVKTWSRYETLCSLQIQTTSIKTVFSNYMYCRVVKPLHFELDPFLYRNGESLDGLYAVVFACHQRCIVILFEYAHNARLPLEY